MANQWLRLWHDMPNDPKWRVIAKASKQPLHLVMALYVALLVDASKNKSRGVTTCHDEDLAVTLDCDMSQIIEIKAAMQGRVLDGDHISGWETRQPKREDSGDDETGAKSAAERKRAERERKKVGEEVGAENQCHDMSRNVTLDKDKEEDKEVNTSVSHDKIVFDGSEFKNVNGQMALWEKAYPAIAVGIELNKAAAWLAANPKNKKSNYARFLTNWLARAQDSAPKVASQSTPAGWVPPKTGDTRTHPIYGSNERFIEGTGWVAA